MPLSQSIETRRPSTTARRLPVGAEPVAGGVHFRVWAPAASRVVVALAGGAAEHALVREDGAWRLAAHAAFVPAPNRRADD